MEQMIKAFRGLLILSWIFSILGVVSDELTRNELPSPLREYASHSIMTPREPQDTVLLAVGIPSFVAFVVATVSLFKLKRWSRTLFTISFFIFVPLSLFEVPSVSTQISSALSYIGTLASGGVLAMAYFSPLSSYFHKPRD